MIVLLLNSTADDGVVVPVLYSTAGDVLLQPML